MVCSGIYKRLLYKNIEGIPAAFICLLYSKLGWNSTQKILAEHNILDFQFFTFVILDTYISKGQILCILLDIYLKWYGLWLICDVIRNFEINSNIF